MLLVSVEEGSDANQLPSLLGESLQFLLIYLKVLAGRLFFREHREDVEGVRGRMCLRAQQEQRSQAEEGDEREEGNSSHVPVLTPGDQEALMASPDMLLRYENRGVYRTACAAFDR